MAYKFVKARARQARLDGRGQCPYPAGTKESVVWLHEWFMEEQELNESIEALRRQYQREHHT